MKKLAAFIVNKRYYILSVMLVIALAFAACIPFVEINDDMTRYLPSNSAMRQGLNIMEEAFPETETSQSIRVMFTDLEEGQIAEIKTQLESIKNVDSVSYDTSENYNKDNYTLFVLNISCDYGSAEETAIINALKAQFSDYDFVYRNNDTSIGGIPTWTLITALTILVVILLAMCGSWFEPLLFLGVIGIAIVMNMGSNIILGTISSITFSIGAILQLVLSMDYSIILMNRYRQERRLTENKYDAMKNALANSFGSISSSSLTTIVGLLMLCFMSFTIGLDLGIVLAKGVFMSLLCVFTVLPALILLCDKVILKTEKKHKHKNKNGNLETAEQDEAVVGMGAPVLTNTPTQAVAVKKCRTFSDIMAGFEFKARYVIMGAFVVIFALACVFQAYTPTNFTLNNDDTIAEIFPSANTIVIVYNNDDEQNVVAVANKLTENEYVSSVSSYGETLGKPYNANELAQMIGAMVGIFTIDAPLISVIYYDKLDGTIYPVKAGIFFGFIYNLAQNDSISALIPAEMQGQIEMLNNFSNKENLITPLPSAHLAQSFGMGESQVKAILQAGQKGDTASISEFINIASEMAKNPQAGIDEATAARLIAAQTIINAVVSDSEFTAKDMSAIIGLDENTTELLYLLYASNTHYNNDWQLSLHDFVNHVYEMSNGKLAPLLNDNIKSIIAAMKTQLDEGAAQLKGDKYSRLILSTTLPEDGGEMTEFFDDLTAALDKTNAEYYIVGNSAMNYEMGKTFDKELLLITILTITAIFLVVAFSFRNLIIPAILVLLVQCGVYITVVTLHFTGVYYLALLIVECILMGATIDYGILFTNYYRENRATMSPQEAVKSSYKGAMHTILTSGLILILVTGIIGLLSTGTMSEICLAISIGTLSAAILILLVLPALLITFDKAITHKITFKKKSRIKNENRK